MGDLDVLGEVGLAKTPDPALLTLTLAMLGLVLEPLLLLGLFGVRVQAGGRFLLQLVDSFEVFLELEVGDEVLAALSTASFMLPLMLIGDVKVLDMSVPSLFPLKFSATVLALVRCQIRMDNPPENQPNRI